MNGKQPISHLCSTPHTNGHSPRADSTNPFSTQPFAIHPNTLSIRNPSPSPFAQRTRSRRCQQSSASSPAASSATTFTFCPSPHLQPIWLPLSISKRTGLKLVPQLGHRRVFDALYSSCAETVDASETESIHTYTSTTPPSGWPPRPPPSNLDTFHRRPLRR